MRKLSILVVAAAAASGALAAVPAGAATSASTTKFCDANFKISLLFNTLPDGEPTAKQLKAFAKQLNPQLAAARKVAPSDIKAEVETAATALKADPSSLFTDDAVGEAGAAIDEWAVANCDYETVDVTAAEYSFTGIPSTLQKGKTVITLNNTVKVFHEVLIVRNKGKMSTEDLLALPEAKARKQVEEIGAAFAAPGETGSGYLDIKTAGKYIALCAIPVGTTDIEAVPDGPPHFTEGMVTEFTVR